MIIRYLNENTEDKEKWKHRGGGLVVTVLAFYYDDPSSNTAEFYHFLL